MKKSQLRNIIKESINELMNEQVSFLVNGTIVNKMYGCGSLSLEAQNCIQNPQNNPNTPIQVGDIIKIMSSNYPPDTTDALGNTISNVPMWAPIIGKKFFATQVGGSCQFQSGQAWTRPDGYVVPSHGAMINMDSCGGCCNKYRWRQMGPPRGYCWYTGCGNKKAIAGTPVPDTKKVNR